MDDAKITKPNRKETKAQANRAYKAMNTLLFDGALEDIDIKLSNTEPIRNGEAFALYCPQSKNIYLRESLVADWDTTALINELFHEMIHKYNHEIAHVSDYKNGYHTHEFLEAAEQHGGFFVDEIPDEETGYNNIELRKDVFFEIFDAI